MTHVLLLDPGHKWKKYLPPLHHHSFTYRTSGTHRADLKVNISIDMVNCTFWKYNGKSIFDFFNADQNAPRIFF